MKVSWSSFNWKNDVFANDDYDAGGHFQFFMNVCLLMTTLRWSKQNLRFALLFARAFASREDVYVNIKPEQKKKKSRRSVVINHFKVCSVKSISSFVIREINGNGRKTWGMIVVKGEKTLIVT